MNFLGLQTITKLINETTKEDDNSQPSGYILKDLSDRSRGSITDTHAIVDGITSVLKKDSPSIKFKALKIIKFVAENGHPDFRLCWQRRSDVIRHCTKLKGAPHPLYGDAPYAKVREKAKEVMNSVFNPNPTQKVASARLVGIGGNDQTPNFSSRSTRFRSNSGAGIASVRQGLARSLGSIGNSSANSSKTSTLGSSKKMQGFGNPNYAGPQTDATFVMKLSTIFNNNNVNVKNPLTEGHRDPYAFKREQEAQKSYYEHSKELPSFGERRRKKGTIGGDWGREESNNRLNVPQERDHTIDLTRKTSSNVKQGDIYGSDNLSSYEHDFINKFTTSVGVKAPSTDELNKFVMKCRSLNKPIIASLLNECLNSTKSWQIQLKTLYLIEALVKDYECSFIAEYFVQQPTNLKRLLLNSLNKTIRFKSNKLLISLGIDDSNQGSTSYNSASIQKNIHTEDLINFDEIIETPSIGSGDCSNSLFSQVESRNDNEEQTSAFEFVSNTTEYDFDDILTSDTTGEYNAPSLSQSTISTLNTEQLQQQILSLQDQLRIQQTKQQKPNDQVVGNTNEEIKSHKIHNTQQFLSLSQDINLNSSKKENLPKSPFIVEQPQQQMVLQNYESTPLTNESQSPPQQKLQNINNPSTSSPPNPNIQPQQQVHPTSPYFQPTAIPIYPSNFQQQLAQLQSQITQLQQMTVSSQQSNVAPSNMINTRTSPLRTGISSDIFAPLMNLSSDTSQISQPTTQNPKKKDDQFEFVSDMFSKK